MNKALRIEVVDPSFIPDGFNHPTIKRCECEHILKQFENKSESMGDVEKAIDTLINHIVTNSISYMMVDIDGRNKALAPAKEMTFDDIEKELGYKIKIVKEKNNESKSD